MVNLFIYNVYENFNKDYELTINLFKNYIDNYIDTRQYFDKLFFNFYKNILESNNNNKYFFIVEYDLFFQFNLSENLPIELKNYLNFVSIENGNLIFDNKLNLKFKIDTKNNVINSFENEELTNLFYKELYDFVDYNHILR